MRPEPPATPPRPAVHGALVRALLVLVMVATPLRAQAPPQLLPVDEAATRPEFFSFRAQLQRALAERDSAAVLAIVDPNIKSSFGDDDGIASFRKMWLPDRPDSELWGELGTVLAMGGSFFDAHTFVAPYVFSKWPDQHDAFEHVAITGASVRVRAEPRTDGRLLTTLSFAIVPTAQDARTAEGWTAIRLGSGTGFVADRFARSPIDYRAIFSDASGQWRLVTFVAGD